MPLMAAHMVLAAYIVGGLPGGLGVRRTACCAVARDRYHRVGFTIAFSVAAIATPIQMGVGDSLARWVYNNQPIKFAAIELVPTTSSDVPETLFGHLNSDGTVSGWHPDPRPGVDRCRIPPTARRPWSRASTPCRPTTRPTISEVNTVHLAWDLMVGLGTMLLPAVGVVLAVAGSSASGGSRRAACSCPRASGAGVAVGGHDGGRLGRQRGRPTTVDRLQPDEGRGRGHRQHRRVDHVPARRRALHRARGDDDPDPAQDEPSGSASAASGDDEVPYGPSSGALAVASTATTETR